MDERLRDDRPRWWALLLVALVAVAAGIGVGVAVSGLPDDDTDSATDAGAPATSDGSVSTVPLPSTTDPGIADPETTVPDATTAPPTIAPDTTAPATTAPVTTSAPDTTEPGTTAPGTTAPPTTATPTTDVDETLPARDEIRVVVANGNGVAGAAGFAADLLRLAGYTQVALANGTELFEQTVVYHDEGFGPAAVRLVDDLDLGDVFVIPIADAPPTDPPSTPPTGDAQILVYLGAT